MEGAGAPVVVGAEVPGGGGGAEVFGGGGAEVPGGGGAEELLEPIPPGGPLDPAGGTSGCFPDNGVVEKPQPVPAAVKVKP